MTLSGTNTYGGGTVVSAGTLAVSGSIGAVSVQNGGTLQGNGTVAAITLAGGTLSPGNSPGTLVGTSLDWQSGGIVFELGRIRPGVIICR